MRELMVVSMLLSGVALGHGGRLDRYGCHHNRKTGDYHCHNRANAAPVAKAKPVRGRGTGALVVAGGGR